MAKKLDLTIAQLNPVVGDLDGNRDKIVATMAEYADRSNLIVFPEMIVTGYPPDDLVLKPYFMQRVEESVNEIIAATAEHECAIILPAPVREGDQLYNCAFFAENGEIVATIYKNHLPNYGVFDEARLFQPGPLPEAIDFHGVRLGIIICEDMWYQDIAETLGQQNVEAFIVVNASPYETQKDARRIDGALSCVDRAGVPLVYVNQVGGQDELVFDGHSFILNPDGHIIYRAPACREITQTLRLEHMPVQGRWLIESAPVHTPMAQNEAIYEALMLGLRDYVTKNGFPGVIIGLSGGIDSALTAALAVDALESECVRCVLMPSPITAQTSLDDGQALAHNLGAPHETIPIAPGMKAFEQMLPEIKGLAHENMQSRVRGTVLMSMSNRLGYMLLATGNKSEMAVGYATLYGDMCGGFNVLKDVYKTKVYELARWRNDHKPVSAHGPHGEVIPQNILDKEPTAELRENQKDTDSLPAYDVLDDILYCLVEKDMGWPQITERGHDEQTVEHVRHMLDVNEYKRRQSAPGVKITERAFGRERRYPMTNRF
jgi:NAD+ synthase